MIIKSLSRRANFNTALNYVNRNNLKEEKHFTWNINTKTDDIKEIWSEFKENAQYMQKRKNGVLFYHEIISLNEKDKSNSNILIDLAKEYIRIRAWDALVYGKVHINEGKNPHIHLIISANHRKSKKKLRLSKFQFLKIKKQMERYQKLKYPDLEYSKVNHWWQVKENERNNESNEIKSKNQEVKKEKSFEPKKTRGERERDRRLKKTQTKNPSEKDRIAHILRKCLDEASSQQIARKRMAENSLELYHRGKTTWVQNTATGRKHRLKTLWLAEAYTQALERWDQIKQRKIEFDKIQIEKGKQIVKEMGFKKDIKNILQKRIQITIKAWRLESRFQNRLDEIESLMEIKRRYARESLVKQLER